MEVGRGVEVSVDSLPCLGPATGMLPMCYMDRRVASRKHIGHRLISDPSTSPPKQYPTRFHAHLSTPDQSHPTASSSAQ